MCRLLPFSFACLMAAPSLHAQRPDRPQAPPVPPTVEAKPDLPYAGTDNKRQQLDLYLSKTREAGKTLPALVFPDKVRSANPITYVDPTDPPFLIVHGDKDPLVPHGQSEILAAALKKAKIPHELYTVPGGGHGGFKDPEVPQKVRAFLEARFEKKLGR